LRLDISTASPDKCRNQHPKKEFPSSFKYFGLEPTAPITRRPLSLTKIMALVQNHPPPASPASLFYPSFMPQAGPSSPQHPPSLSTKPVGSRPLPAIPVGDPKRQSHIPFTGTSSIRHPLLTPQSERRSSDLSDSASRVPRQPRLSSRFQFQPATRDRAIPSLFASLGTSSILRAILASLEWADVYALLTTCRTLVDSFQTLSLRDVVLSRFVPGYAQCLRVKDMQFYQDIPITVYDLNRLGKPVPV
jgi:hypothetical protein